MPEDQTKAINELRNQIAALRQLADEADDKACSALRITAQARDRAERIDGQLQAMLSVEGEG